MSRAKEILKKEETNEVDTEKSEAFDVSQAIKSLVDTNFSGSDEEQGKASQLIKGLFFSDDEKAKKFVKKIDQLTSNLNLKDFE